MSAAYALSATMPSDVDMHPLQTSDPQPSTALDPPDASALRQAALKSIRSKRRKPVVEPDALALSARPIPPSPPTLLDYGTEDSTYAGPPAPSTSTTTNGPTPLAAANSFGGASTGEIIPEEDITMREEGEISENEDPPPPPLPSRLPPARSNTSVDISTPVRRSPPKRTTPPLASRPPLPPVKIEPAVPSLSPPRSTSVSGSSRQGHREFALTPTSLNGGLFRIEAYGYVIDAAHVRPGLSLTQDQYNSTKDIVLDLLGWGVPPEYLVDCGLSREIIFYVFTELNLRLPANFDPTGIPPFPPPPEAVTYVPIAPEPPPQDFNGDDPFASSSHPSLPSKPSVPQGLTARSSTPHAALNSLSVDAPPFVPRGMAVAAPEGSDNLAAMEQLKRQELLARKAVQASRRRHETSSFTSADGASSGQPSAITVDTRPVVPQASVDDFLKTIDASSTGSATSSAGPSRDNSFLNGRRAASPDAMDVDDDIPGLGGQASFASNNSQYEDREATPPPSTAMDSSSTDDSPEEMAVELSLGLGLPEDSEMDSGPTPPLSHDNSSRSSSTPQPAAPVPRRGLKRPVAADFVDVDSGASNPYALAPPSRTGSIGNGNGQAHTYGGAHHPNPHVRRRMHAAAAGGFASVSGTRRCVIDISDSEDGDEEEVPVSGTPTTSADDLEVEIQRMRALIKLREEQKLRKLAMSGRATPQSREVPAGQETATQSLQGASHALPCDSLSGGNRLTRERPFASASSGLLRACWLTVLQGLLPYRPCTVARKQ
ncbi:hypothetical protein FA95DRAFT_1532610 [Auriscalpium vulgare]|uniref:Uncharacterized protein n=1 Tax=Auriscalpium vulgare TaxID=40419 RepID=A0ACB8S954_9AGAM|nr:hypothetical protein FA95DRAFT_1532610 [Auriscalpium vulgare]